MQFLAAPVEYIRPFLGPIYAWASIGGRFAKPKLPTMILLIMKFIAKELEHRHMMPRAARFEDLGEMIRMDAKAEGDKIVIGGSRVRGEGRTQDAE